MAHDIHVAPKLDNNTQRILTGLVLIPLTTVVTWWGGLPMLVLILPLTVIGTLEFYHMEQQRYHGTNVVLGVICAVLVVLGFYFASLAVVGLTLLGGAVVTLLIEWLRTRALAGSAFRILTTMGGVLYIAVPAGCLLAIRAIPVTGVWWAFAIYLATWGTDTAAYFVGRQFGKTPLAPKLSPKKTLEGAVGGVIGGITFPFILLLYNDLASWGVIFLLIAAPFVAIWGDLFESALKRYFGLKDSAIHGLNLFPGHGGVLDRIDALVWVTSMFYLYLLISDLLMRL